MTTYFLPQAGALLSANLLYFYAAAGAPRWSLAQTVDNDFAVATRWISDRGYCRNCPTAALIARDGGPLALSLTTPLPLAGLDNQLSMAAVHAGAAGGTWNRQIRLQRISGLFPTPRTAATREGLLAGAADTGATIAWRGIPFAAAPTGTLRWRAPQAARSRQRVLAATEFGPGCPQAPAQGFFGGAPPRTDEDCLSLNVWAPESAAHDSTPLPVMVWIHGGGHVQGGSSQLLGARPLYDGSIYAQRGIVLVSINYRLGPLGYAAFRELIGEHPDQPGTGNYGLLDQLAALRWVRDNIGAFGGDPANVTIFGESAGGVSVCAVLASPLATGLFARAIIQSGVCTVTVPRLLISNGSREPAVAKGDRIKQRLGCPQSDARECLRAKTAAELVTAGEGAVAFSGSGESYAEVIDGFALNAGLGDAIREGTAAQVPMMIGINEDETTSLVPVAQRPQTAAAYESLVRSRLSPLIAMRHWRSTRPQPSCRCGGRGRRSTPLWHSSVLLRVQRAIMPRAAIRCSPTTSPRACPTNPSSPHSTVWKSRCCSARCPTSARGSSSSRPTCSRCGPATRSTGNPRSQACQLGHAIQPTANRGLNCAPAVSRRAPGTATDSAISGRVTRDFSRSSRQLWRQRAVQHRADGA